jgi:hypothetical protein
MSITGFERFSIKRGHMRRIIFSSLLGLICLSSLTMTVHADDWEARQRAAIDRQTAKAGLNNAYDGPYGYYGHYGYPAPMYYGNYPYSPPPIYSNPYASPGYMPYYYNPGMYNPNTNFVNPPSSLNYPTGYPTYSETYIYR